MKPILYGVGTALVLAVVGSLPAGMTDAIFVGAALSGLIAWGVAEIKETIYYYYERLKEDKK